MKKILQLIVGVIVLTAFSVAPISAQEYGVNYTRGTAHITTKTTTHIVAKTCVLYTLILNVSNAGTSWTISVQDKASTAHVLWAGTAAGGTIVIELPVGVPVDTGLDIVTAGGTAGVLDVWYAVR